MSSFFKSAPGDDLNEVFSKVESAVKERLDRSSLSFRFEGNAMDIPRFDAGELEVGRVRGRGGFCVVREINRMQLSSSGTDDGTKNLLWKLNLSSHGKASNVDSELNPREYLARRVSSRKGGRYLVKMVTPELVDRDRDTFRKGTIDIALETSFLASLSHPNILSIRGMSSINPYDGIGYFIILDHLPEILSGRLNAWAQKKRTTKGVTGLLTGGKLKVKSLLVERLVVAHDIAAVMDYLHSRQIIYRDLKPDNVGFDASGALKLFDFGLAKDLSKEECDANGLYNLTGITGGLRYMAPEVGLHKPYNLTADMYSWSMLMWYILALEPPMGLSTPTALIEGVFKKGYRPAVKDKWPGPICNVMKQCWSEYIQDRPSWQQVLQAVRESAEKLDPACFSREPKELKEGVANEAPM